MRSLLLTLLVLLPAPILADPPGEPAAPEAVAAPALPVQSGLCPASSSPVQAVWASFSESTIEAECTATCQGGSTVTCSGPSCSAVDADCPANQQGYCWSSSTGYTYCPALVPGPGCPRCPKPSCLEIDGTYCTSSTTCYGPWPGCNAYTCNCYQNQYVCPL